MAISLSTGWSASRLVPRTGLSGTPLDAATSLQRNPMYAQLAKVLGLQSPALPPVQPAIAGPIPAPGYVPAPVPVPGVAPRSAASSMYSQSGNIVLPNSVSRAAPTPLQATLAKAIGIPTVAAPAPAAISGGIMPTGTDANLIPSGGTDANLIPSGGTLGYGWGIAPGGTPYGPGAPTSLSSPVPATNATIPGVTNFNTLANQNQNLPDWLRNAIANLNSPDNFNPVAPAPVPVGGFDPRIGATMAATEARIAAQQKALAEENKARIARVKADAAAVEHAHELQVQRMRGGFGGQSSGSGWV